MHNLPMECASVFLISTEAALFGPSKYGLLPELLPENRLSWGNGIIELGTFVASIAGDDGRGIPCGAVSRARVHCRILPAWIYVRRPPDELRDLARSGSRSGKEVSVRIRWATSGSS